jgi:hypothetical protein
MKTKFTFWFLTFISSKNYFKILPGIFLILGMNGFAQAPIFSPSMPITCVTPCSSPTNEQVINVIDRNINTKFLDFKNTDGTYNTGFIVNTGSTSIANQFHITTANDAPGRDPVDFAVDGSPDGVTWTNLGSGAIPCTTARRFTRTINFTNTTPARWYRIRFVSVCTPTTNNGTNSIQMAEVQLFGTASAPLPVKLISFNTRIKNGNAFLQWTVADPEAGDFYEVQRSSDGNNFTSIGTINNNGSLSFFSYTDQATPSGTVYYRLRLTDKEGVTKFSGVNLLKQPGKGMSLSVYPNPVPKGSPVQVSITDATLQSWKLVDLVGKVLAFGSNLNVTGATSLRLPATLEAGAYYLQLQTDKGIHNQKLIIQ